MKRGKYNNTTLFLLPMLVEEFSNQNKDAFDPHGRAFFLRPNFIGCYINFHDNLLELAYKMEQTLDFPGFERKLEHLPNFFGDYDIKGMIVYEFNIPEKWQPEFDMFESGKYSKFSKEYKDHILKFWGQHKGSPLHSLFYDTEKFTKILQTNHEVDDLSELNNDGEFWPKWDETDTLEH